jgi:hypothetical protein
MHCEMKGLQDYRERSSMGGSKGNAPAGGSTSARRGRALLNAEDAAEIERTFLVSGDVEVHSEIHLGVYSLSVQETIIRTQGRFSPSDSKGAGAVPHNPCGLPRAFQKDKAWELPPDRRHGWFYSMKAMKSTKTRFVVKFLSEVISAYGSPFRVITDKGTAFTAKKFRQFCRAHQINHVEVAVATPRANGQVERLNRSVLSALATTSKSEDTWDTVVNNVQFAINNTVNKTTNRTPSELLMGYKPNPSGLFKVIPDLNDVIRDLEALRKETQMRIAAEQEHQKRYFDEKRKPPHQYQVNDQVLVATNPTADGSSRKLTDKLMGPLVVTGILPNDRYLVEDLPGSVRSARTKYRNVVAVDRMRPFVAAGDLSESSGEDNESDQVAQLG